MCGRFTLLPTGQDIASLFNLDDVPDWQPRYTIAEREAVRVVGSPIGHIGPWCWQ